MPVAVAHSDLWLLAGVLFCLKLLLLQPLAIVTCYSCWLRLHAGSCWRCEIACLELLLLWLLATS